MNPLQKLQKILETVYNLPHHFDADRFLINHHTLQKMLKSSPQAFEDCHWSDQRNEMLLVQSDQETVSIALFIDPGVINNLVRHDPWQDLSLNNWDDFWTAVEGISHFLFLLQRVRRAQPVRPLEFELQAEVDKYLLFRLFFVAHRQASVDLKTSLFDRYKLVPNLSPEERERYQLANRLAWQYCTVLERRFVWNSKRLLLEIRHFYPLSLPEKIHRIQTGLIGAS